MKLKIILCPVISTGGYLCAALFERDTYDIHIGYCSNKEYKTIEAFIDCAKKWAESSGLENLYEIYLYKLTVEKRHPFDKLLSEDSEKVSIFANKLNK